jgi:hypothetical protein
MGSDERRSSLFKNSSYCRSLFLIDFQYTILQAVSVPYRSDSRQNPAWSAAWTGHLQHNLMRVEWDNEGGTEMTLRFNHQITETVQAGRAETVLNYPALPDASYAVPTPC